MPLPVIADTFRLAYNWHTTDGTSATGVQHFHAPGLTASDVGTLWLGEVDNTLWHNVSARAVITDIEITPLDGSSAATVMSTGSTSDFTGAGSAENIVEACSIISFRTAQRGARGRGRQFLPFVPEDAQSGGKLIGSNLTQPPGAWLTWANNMDGGGATLVVASYAHADQHTVTSIGIDQVIGVQRRRVERLRG